MCPPSLTTKDLSDQAVGLKSELEDYQVYDEGPEYDPQENFDISSYPLVIHLKTEIKTAEKNAC